MRPSSSDDQFLRELEQLEAAVAEFKTGNQLTGGSNIVYHTSQTDQPSDWSGILGAGRRKYVLITAQAAEGSYLFASVTAKLYRGGSSDWYRPSDELADNKAGRISSYVYIRPTGRPTSNRQQWLAEVNGNSTDRHYLKVYVSGSARATVTAQEVT